MSPFERAMNDLPLLAILRGLSPDAAIAVGETLLEAGFHALEVPLNSPSPFLSIEMLAERFGEKALIGAGTVLSTTDITSVASAGGRLIVMPHAAPPLIRHANHLGLTCLPGVATPTEAFSALEAGAHGLKLFPAEALPPKVVKAWRAVLPAATKLLPVGGIGPDSMAPYLDVGADGFGLGSALYVPGIAIDTLAARAKHFVDTYRHATMEG